MRLRLKEDPREWQKFALSAVVGLSALIALLCWRGILPARWVAGLLVPLGLALLAALVRPRWFRRPYRGGMTAGHHLGGFMSGVLLTVFFFLVLTPLGLALRLAGKDLLRLKRDPQAKSYWLPVRNSSQLDRMF